MQLGRGVLGVLLVLAGGLASACSQAPTTTAAAPQDLAEAAADLGPRMAFAQDDAQDDAQEDAQEEAPPDLVLTTSLEQRYPLLRFLRHADGSLTVFLPFPKGGGAEAEGHLRAFCTCLDPDPETHVEGNATLQVLSDGGRVLSSDVTAAPWAGVQEWKAVEDLLVVHGTEAQVDEILSFINLFYNAAPQVEIQAQIFEVTETGFFERGVLPATGEPLITNRSGIGPNNEGPFLRNIGGSFPTGTGQTLASGPGGVFEVALLENEFQLQALLQILATNENVDIVSRPRVVVRNGVNANLSSAEKFPVLEPQTISAQGVTANKILYKDIGVTLNVLPFLMGDDTVHLVIEAEVSRIGRTVVLATDTAGNPIFSPTINTRNAKTSVSVRSGQSVVIGGLRLREERETKNKVPILGDIPVLDLVFSSTSEELVETEVLFVITPLLKAQPSISKFGDIFDPFADTQ